MKMVPWHHRAEVHKDPEIQQRLQCRVEGVMSGLRLGVIQTVPVECVPGYETSQRLIGAEATARADNE